MEFKQQFDALLSIFDNQPLPTDYDGGGKLFIPDSSGEIKNKLIDYDIPVDISDTHATIFVDGLDNSRFYYDTDNFVKSVKTDSINWDFGILSEKLFYDFNKKQFTRNGIKIINSIAENHLYFLKIKSLITDGYSNPDIKVEIKPVAEYYDSALRKLVLITSKGVIKIGYPQIIPQFDSKYSLKDFYNRLFEGLKGKGYSNLFRYEVLSLVKDQENEEERLQLLISNLELVLDNTDVSHEVYMSDFSFESLKDKIRQEKIKYYNATKEILSKTYTQITGITIVASASAFATSKVDNPIVLLFVVISYIVYAGFVGFLLRTLYLETVALTSEFELEKVEILSSSGLNRKARESEIKAISSRFKIVKNVVIAFGICFTILSLLFLVFVWWQEEVLSSKYQETVFRIFDYYLYYILKH